MINSYNPRQINTINNNVNTVLTRTGENTDAPSMSSTLFAAMQALYNQLSIRTSFNHSESAGGTMHDRTETTMWDIDGPGIFRGFNLHTNVTDGNLCVVKLVIDTSTSNILSIWPASLPGIRYSFYLPFTTKCKATIYHEDGLDRNYSHHVLTSN